MCGIIAYIGQRAAHQVLLKGLQRLEYRGYDSAGIALINPAGTFDLYKQSGKLQNLKDSLKQATLTSHIGIGHTRWATHGSPNKINAHPHLSYNGRLAIVHNGIIENYRMLREQLLTAGCMLHTDTDTEVLCSFIAYHQVQHNCTLEEAVRCALPHVVGAYAIVILDRETPDTMVAARKGSPMVVGLGQEELFLASDVTPLIEYTDQVIYVKDQEILTVKNTTFTLTDLANTPQQAAICTLDLSHETAEKDGFPHFMLKEIYEQPRTLRDGIRGRVLPEAGRIQLGGIQSHIAALQQTQRLTLLACGSAWHASLVAKYWIERYARVPVDVTQASEYRYHQPVINVGDVAIAVSQSGETADTLAAASLARAHHVTLLGVCNVVSSSIARLTAAGVYTHAGLEIGVASTKAYTAQLVVLAMMALWIAQQRSAIEPILQKALVDEIEQIPEKISLILDQNDQILAIAKKIYKSKGCLFIGRGGNYPTALEGALKLKEVTYMHASGYAAGELKHGPIALVAPETPTVVLVPQDEVYEKNLSSMAEIKARNGPVIAVVTKGDIEATALADHVITIPVTHTSLTPILTTIPLQLLAYHVGVLRGCDVDKPRNLAKSVTVE